jgi:hypothetical protein
MIIIMIMILSISLTKLSIGKITYRRYLMNDGIWSNGGLMTGKNRVPKDKPIPMALYSPKIPYTGLEQNSGLRDG